MYSRLMRYGMVAVALMAVVALTVACNADGNVTAPNLADDATQGLKHHRTDHDGGGGNGGGGGGDDDGGGGGGKQMATFEWSVDGDVDFVPLTDPDLVMEHKVKDGDTQIHATFQDDGYNADKEVDVSYLLDEGIANAATCFGDGNLPPGSFVIEGEDQPAMHGQIVFTGWNQDGTEQIKYILKMDGTLIDGPWLPVVDDPDANGSTVRFDSWDLSTQNRDKNKNPCVGSDAFDLPVSVNIVRTQ